MIVRAGACLLLILSLVACSSSGDSAGRALPTTPPAPSTTAAVTTTSTAPVTTAPATTQPGTAPCPSSSLALSSAEGRAALGHALYLFGLRNTSSQLCRLEGHPTVALLDAQGRVLARARPGAGYILPDRPPRSVSLAPGATGWFGLEATTLCEGDATPVPSSRMSVSPPGQTGTLSAEVTIDICPDAAVLISPVRAAETDVTR